MRPNSGRIEPGDSTEVSRESRVVLLLRTRLIGARLLVLLQPMKEGPPLSVKCKDKFLVQSTIITTEKDQPGADLVSSPLDQYCIGFAYG
jgi:hypothetical protein